MQRMPGFDYVHFRAKADFCGSMPGVRTVTEPARVRAKRMAHLLDMCTAVSKLAPSISVRTVFVAYEFIPETFLIMT